MKGDHECRDGCPCVQVRVSMSVKKGVHECKEG